ncbi:TlpA family protein disulfide reductase [Chitinophaga horti]|uniref:TlpA family protein disulfide reductase n=1 Tax=Chitinophaga horti TaxID=2920382 RepID=A0ABY6IWL4_9BACT|nr:TlpA disulfide reductase family protein [Chitinophaga horti]UYQ91773.1 TlpA family protein disulfide reductase [Chitinophaga horti]
MKPLILLLLTIFCQISSSYAQRNQSYYPKEGDTIPDFTFNNVINHQNKSLSISDLRGKWLVLDWWALGCLGCIKSFPKMNRLSETFKDKVNFIMIGEYGKRRSVSGSRDFYLMKQRKDNLNMIAAFDSSSFDKYAIRAVPLILVVNPNGIIVAKTLYLDSTQLECFISGDPVNYEYAYSKGEKYRDIPYNQNLPLLATGGPSNGGIDTCVLARSVLTKWNPKLMPSSSFYGFDEFSFLQKNDYAFASGVDINQLIRIAYLGKTQINYDDPSYGKISPAIIFETSKGAALFTPNIKAGTNLFSYAISSKALTAKIARESLLHDLESTFSIETTLENRKVPAWTLIVTDTQKVSRLRTKGEKKKSIPPGAFGGINVKNWPTNQLYSAGLFSSLLFKEGDFINAPIFVDKTGIDFNIDLSLKADMTDLEEVKRELRQRGLDIIIEPYEMTCIIVRDKKTTPNSTAKN